MSQQNHGAIQAGERIREARSRMGLTQTTLAKSAGCKQSQISAVERGKFSAIGHDRLMKLLEKLSLNTDDFRSFLDPSAKVLIICSRAECLSHKIRDTPNGPVMVPGFLLGDPADRRHCAMCGDAMINACEECGRPLEPGLFCPGCGEPYVAVVDSAAEWDREERRTLANELQSIMKIDSSDSEKHRTEGRTAE